MAPPLESYRVWVVGLYTKTEPRTVKYLNNLIEQDHRPIKRRNKFYQSLRTASSTIKGMETIRGIYKKNRRNGGSIISVVGKTTVGIIELFECTQKVPLEL